ncbi:KEOPS complex subunit Pcc1 [Halorussus rarus]|uniref:KEOPS complex subunit Pcc1 n=1 Tax=Halorussus TaxID=1070314 RepID=UPI000E20F189|nr:KEOPS complex Pcc1-like subunit [Halorussus sp. JP-T4]
MGDRPRGADDPSRDATPPASDASADAARRPHDATLRFEYESPARARAVARAVAQEVGEIDGDRSAAVVDRDERTVAVRVVADDLVALRAGCNTWGSLVEVAERTTALG